MSIQIPPETPTDLALKELIDKVALKVVSSPKGDEIESLMKLKQLHNKQFEFLKTKTKFNEYYRNILCL